MGIGAKARKCVSVGVREKERQWGERERERESEKRKSLLLRQKLMDPLSRPGCRLIGDEAKDD